MATTSQTVIKCVNTEKGSFRFRCRGVDKGLFEFDRTLSQENFAKKYAEQKGLSYETGQSSDDTMVIPKSTSCQHGLIAAVEECYNRHIALELSAEDFWVAISQAVSLYLSDKTNAEKYRHRFVSHDGQKMLAVLTESDMSTSRDWAWFVNKITDMIEGNMNQDFVELMTTPFSSTTPLESTIFKISLMEAAQHYFEYYCMTMCGIPEICIRGTVSDFEDIKRRLKAIGELLGGLKWWTDKISQTMDKVIETVSGNPDVTWWNTIVSISWPGSGVPSMTGWISDFIPFTKSGDGKVTPNYSLDWRHLNPGLTYTPVTWENLVTGEKSKLRLCAGFLGIAKNEEAKRLRPAKGWMIFKE